jgi:hypothetical protein
VTPVTRVPLDWDVVKRQKQRKLRV